MTATHQFFRHPKLRPGVEVEGTDTGFALLYRRQGTDLDVPAGAREEVGRLLDGLSAGATASQLAAEAPGLGDLEGMLDELDRLGLLTEGMETETGYVTTGPELYLAVRRFAARLRAELGESRLYRAMVDGSVIRHQLVGYAIEYHHVVRLSPALIAPALSHAWEPTAFDVLQKFLGEELGHDAMTRRALAAAGVSAESLAALQPLPSTFAVCATLGVTAAQDPLSFAGCLFLVEETQPEFNRALAASAEDVGLSSGFVQPLLEHSGVNEEGGHQDISRDLFATVGCIGIEHEQAVLKQVAVMVESLARMDAEILDHYGSSELRLRDFGGLSMVQR